VKKIHLQQKENTQKENKMKKIIITFMLIFGLVVNGLCASNFNDLNGKQKQLLQWAYEHGKEYNIGYTLAAIMWQESFVGDKIVKVNLQDPSAGLWHKNVMYACKEHDIDPNGLNLNKMAQKLINDDEFAMLIAMADIMMWLEKRDGDWFSAWASYNGGGYYDSQKAQNYAKNINKKVSILVKELNP